MKGFVRNALLGAGLLLGSLSAQAASSTAAIDTSLLNSATNPTRIAQRSENPGGGMYRNENPGGGMFRNENPGGGMYKKKTKKSKTKK